MPREYVEGSLDTPRVAGQEPWRVVVGWDRDQDVQIATVDPSADFASRESGLWIHLDRHGINRLIRNLRRARDQAFGRDE